MTTVARVNAAGLVVLTYRSFKTKQNKKKPLAKQQKSTKRDPSYWEYVDALHFMQNSNSSVKHSASSS